MYKVPGTVVWKVPRLGLLSRADFTIGATQCVRGQDRRVCVGMSTCLLPGEGGMALSLAGCPGQLKSQAARDSGVELVAFLTR